MQQAAQSHLQTECLVCHSLRGTSAQKCQLPNPLDFSRRRTCSSETAGRLGQVPLTCLTFSAFALFWALASLFTAFFGAMLGHC